MILDRVAIHDVRMTPSDGLLNAIGIGLIGVGALAPLAAPASVRTVHGSLGERLGPIDPTLSPGCRNGRSGS